MIVELGHFALILAFCLMIPQIFFGLMGAAANRPAWLMAANRAVVGQFVLTGGAFACLWHALYMNDFSVLYVAQNSNSQLPTMYRFAALWGAHEGSLLLWSLVLSGWSFAAVALNRTLPNVLLGRVVGVLGIISAAFALFILLLSNPFERLWPAAMDGRDLNPLLQDKGLMVHPPMLYLGYVGLAVPFAFAVAVMLEGKLEAATTRWVRQWTLAAWMFLTVGIALGSWWAYYELGWGGWWFWDPVENASFMPWLIATALIHSLAVSEKRGQLKHWSLLLAIFGFSFSWLGTFLVRSGVIESVHAFASDPERGLYILTFLGLSVGAALTIYAMRASRFAATTGFGIVSRESFLLLNNVLLVAATLLILIGTLYPLVLDGFGLGKVSVGPPYFSVAFLIPMLPLVLLLAPGMHAQWKQARLDKQRVLILLLGGSVIGAAAVMWFAYDDLRFMPLLGCTLGLWIVAASLIEPVSRLRKGHSLSAGVLAMSVAHLGLGLFVLGATITESYTLQMDHSLSAGQSVTVSGYEFRVGPFRELQGPNYKAVESEVTVWRDGEQVTVLYPQKRLYEVRQTLLTEAGIDVGWSRDLLVSMGEDLGNGTWSMRLQFKPMVRFVWWGAAIMAIGGLIGILDRRYRQRVAAQMADVVGAGTATT